MNMVAQKRYAATVAVKTTGTYQSRAAELVKAMGKALCEVFGTELRCEARGTEPAYWWDLPDNVQVEIERSMGADPKIWVRRNDPLDPLGNDWRNERFERNYHDKLYHVGGVALYAKGEVEHNRKTLADHQANQKALGEELVGVTVPSGMSIERDLKTGHYKVCMEVSLKEINASETKTVIEAFQKLKAVVAPLEPKKVSDEE